MSKTSECAYDADDNAQGIAHLLGEMKLTNEAEIRTYVADPDRVQNFRLFEYVVARKFGAVLWTKIPAAVKKQRKVQQSDCGIDCVTPNFTHVIQAKWRKPTTCLSQRDLGTFFGVGSFMEATRYTVVTSEGVRLSETRAPAIEHVVISNAELISALAACLRPSASLKLSMPNGSITIVGHEPYVAQDSLHKSDDSAAPNAVCKSVNGDELPKQTIASMTRPQLLTQIERLTAQVDQLTTLVANVATTKSVIAQPPNPPPRPMTTKEAEDALQHTKREIAFAMKRCSEVIEYVAKPSSTDFQRYMFHDLFKYYMAQIGRLTGCPMERRFMATDEPIPEISKATK